MRTRTILVFDDNTGIHALYGRALSELGAVEVFGCPEEALERLAEADLVVTDLEMPGMDGLELLLHMHEQGLFVHTLLVTGAGAGHPLLLRATALADAVLEKPFSVKQLRQAVRQLLEPPDRVCEALVAGAA